MPPTRQSWLVRPLLPSSTCLTTTLTQTIIPGKMSTLQFQIPQFMFNGPPILAPGGGAEVLFNEGSTGASWFTNNVFDTEAPTDQ